MKKLLYILIAFLLTGAMIFAAVRINEKSIEKAYDSAVDYIKNCDYENALKMLETANSNKLNSKNFKDNHTDFNKYYKNSAALYAYALAQKEYNDKDVYMHTVNDYLQLIPTDYSGELHKEISTFKGNFNPQYNEFLKEIKRQDEERALLIEESNRKFFADLKTKLPYENMDEKYIDLTMMGKHDKFIPDDDNDDFVYNLYYWDANDGETMLVVACINGKVDHVSKYGVGYYWTEDGKPNYNGKNPYKYKSKSKSTKKSDPYNVNDYYDPEDFYDDNYDDFWDYEDAEDYFNEYHD